MRASSQPTTQGDARPPKVTAEDGLRALRDHVVDTARRARQRYGGRIDYATIRRMLGDEQVVRYPVDLRFDADPLEPGEFAYVEPLGTHPAQGFVLYVHPRFRDREELLPLLIAYHLVRVNYGQVATHEEAELFGSTLLGLDRDAYYQKLCDAADEIWGRPTDCEGSGP